MNHYLVLVAGGKGVRMGSDTPKQFLSLNGKPLLVYAINIFHEVFPDIHVKLVLPRNYLHYQHSLIHFLPDDIDLTVVPGGDTRFHSVKAGLKAINHEGIIFIHDGARPLISKELILNCHLQTLQKGSAIPAISVENSLRQVEEESSFPINRDKFKIIQTPQTFKSELIIPAYQCEYNTAFTDDATVFEAFGQTVNLVEGDKVNIKITTFEDMLIAEALMKNRSNIFHLEEV